MSKPELKELSRSTYFHKAATRRFVMSKDVDMIKSKSRHSNKPVLDVRPAAPVSCSSSESQWKGFGLFPTQRRHHAKATCAFHQCIGLYYEGFNGEHSPGHRSRLDHLQEGYPVFVKKRASRLKSLFGSKTYRRNCFYNWGVTGRNQSGSVLLWAPESFSTRVIVGLFISGLEHQLKHCCHGNLSVMKNRQR